ncbi:hypothetical protein [Stenotrophomonas pavanii]|uniref:hypothetical protein n=1 Tax=Stenotrophomonas pavanii TaxID=487698 RepID=UPI001F178266|nr:hypothetical protein [Stenotrophomonas sp. Sm3212]
METAADAAEQGFLVHARSKRRTWPVAIQQQQFDITDTKHPAQRRQVYRPQAAVVAVSYPTIDHDSVVPPLIRHPLRPPLPDRAHNDPESISVATPAAPASMRSYKSMQELECEYAR